MKTISIENRISDTVAVVFYGNLGESYWTIETADGGYARIDREDAVVLLGLTDPLAATFEVANG